MKAFFATFFLVATTLTQGFGAEASPSGAMSAPHPIVCGVTQDKKPVLCTEAQFRSMLTVLRAAQKQGELSGLDLKRVVHNAGVVLVFGGIAVDAGTLVLAKIAAGDGELAALASAIVQKDFAGLGYLFIGTSAAFAGGVILALTPTPAETGDLCDPSKDLNAVGYVLNHHSDDEIIHQLVPLCPGYGITIGSAAYTVSAALAKLSHKK